MVRTLLTSLLLLLPSLAAAQVGPPTGDVVVRFEEEPGPALLDRLAQGSDVDRFDRLQGAWPVFVARLGPSSDPASVASALQRRPVIRWAEPDLMLHFVLHGAPLNDEYFLEQWHLQNDGQIDGGLPGADVHAVPAWSVTRGEGIRIAVLDTGVDTTHPDLDIVHGVDVLDDDMEPDPDPDYNGAGHGTMVAGVAAAIGDNGIGVAGVAPAAGIIAMRMLGDGGSTSETYDAFILAIDAGADVVNNSWGFMDTECSPVPFVQTLHEALEYARLEGRGGLGTPIVFSAGNQGCEYTEHPLLAEPIVTSVGSLTDQDKKFGYSAWGYALNVMASSGPLGNGARPGLVSTDVVGDVGYGGLGENGEYTRRMGGTSGAAPVVSGTIALMLASNPRLTWEQVGDVLCTTAIRVAPDVAEYDATGWSNTHGCGRVDAAAAVGAVADEGPPADLAWRLSDGDEVYLDYVVLAWDHAVDPDGDAPVYTLDVTPEDAGDDDDSAEVAGLLFEGLTDDRIDLTGEIGLGSWEATLVASDAWGAGEPVALSFDVVGPPIVEPPPPEEEGTGCTSSVAAAAHPGAGVLLLLLLFSRGIRSRLW